MEPIILIAMLSCIIVGAFIVYRSRIKVDLQGPLGMHIELEGENSAEKPAGKIKEAAPVTPKQDDKDNFVPKSQLHEQANSLEENIGAGALKYVETGAEVKEIRQQLRTILQELKPELSKQLDNEAFQELDKEFGELDVLLARLETGLVWIALFGKTSVGKSAVANSLIGDDIAEVGIQMDLTVVPSVYEKQPWKIVDVPGILGKKINERTAIEEAQKAHGFIFVIDGEPLEVELELFNLVHKDMPDAPIVVFVNKWDKMENETSENRGIVKAQIERKMAAFVQSPEDIIYGNAQILNRSQDKMVRQQLPQLLDKLYEDAGSLSQIMNIFDPAKRATGLSETLRLKVFQERAKIARTMIRRFGWLSIASSAIPIPFTEIITAPGILGSLVAIVHKIMGSKLDKNNQQIAIELIKICAQELGASFISLTVLTLLIDTALGPLGALVDLVGLAAFKYHRTVVFGEVVLEYLRTNGNWAGQDRHAAIIACRDRADSLYGRVRISKTKNS